jgi:hypothetical protein
MKINTVKLVAVSVVSFAAGSLVSEAGSQAAPAQTPAAYEIGFMKVSPENVEEYIQMERDIWMPIHRERIRTGQMVSWSLYRVRYPYGTGTDYNYVTVNTYASVEDAERDISSIATRVHSGRTVVSIRDQALATRDLVRGELWTRLENIP